MIAAPHAVGERFLPLAGSSSNSANAPYVTHGTWLAPAGLVDANLKGSAASYAATVANSDRFFVHFFTRDCGALGDLLPSARAQDCTEIGDMVPRRGDATAPGDPELAGMFWLGIRDFVAPGTAHGPDTTQLLTPRILTFTRP